MNWIKDILIEYAKKVTPKAAAVLSGMIIFFVAGYFILDRVLDYQASAVGEKRVIEKTKPEGITQQEFSENNRLYDLDNRAVRVNQSTK